jgi:hypothetical protein
MRATDGSSEGKHCGGAPMSTILSTFLPLLLVLFAALLVTAMIEDDDDDFGGML